MGTGNYLPPADIVYPRTAEVEGGIYYEMVYIDSNYSTKDESVDAILDLKAQFERTLIEDIEARISGAFFRQNGNQRFLTPGGLAEWRSMNIKIVLMPEQYVYYPLIVTPVHQLGIPNTEGTATRLFGLLAGRGYKLSVRTGPWTSGPWVAPSKVSSAGKCAKQQLQR